MVFIFKKAPSKKSEEPQIRNQPQRTTTPIGGDSSEDKELVNGPRLEPGDSSTTDESVAADKAKQRQKFGKPRHVGSDAILLAANSRQQAGDRTSSCLDWIDRRLRRLLSRLGIDMQRQVHDPVSKPAQPPGGHGTRPDETNDLVINNSRYGQAEKDSDILGSRQQQVTEPGQRTNSSYGEAVRGNNKAKMKRTESDTHDLTSHDAPVVERSMEQAGGYQTSVQEPESSWYSQSPMQSQTNTPAQALTLQTLESPKVQEATTMEGSQSNAVVHPEGRDFKRTFRMVIHLSGDQIAQRVSCLDTGADLDVISHRVVESLRLHKERYQGAPIYPLGGFYKPEWQVTFDWHVAGFRETYTSTLAVLDDKHSGDFDVLLGRMTIQNIGFYTPNGKVWTFSRDDEGQPIQCL